MRFANENTDDDFRRAGKDYPLNTDGADWNKVAAALGYPNNLSQAVKHDSRRKYLWLLLLLPFSLVCNRYFENKFDDSEEEMLAKPYVASKPATKVLHSFSKPAPEKSKELAAKNEVTIENRNATHFSEHRFLASRNNAESNAAALGFGPESEEWPAQQTTKREAFPTLMMRETVTLEAKKTLQRNNVANVITKEKKSPRQKRFSIGIETGTGTTTVKFQRTKGFGFDLGLTLGYAFSKRLSVHASVLSSQKNYYTAGESFNASKIYLPVNTKITSVDGSCRMMEIPVALRYHFSASEKGEWFVAAGASSFLMKQEDYDYEYFYANSGQSAKRSRTYKNSSKDWLAVAQFSGGYAYDVKGKFRLEAAPYIQVPLKGAGFGKLPLTSAGLRLSLVKNLF